MQKKKLAIFINTLKRGGAEKVVAFLLNQLQHEFEFHLFAFNSTGIEFEIPADVKIIQLGKPKSSEATVLDLLKMPFQSLTIRKYLEKNNIPVLLSFLNRPNFISSIVKISGWKGKVLISERTMTSAYYTNKTLGGRFGRFLVSKLYAHADLVITNSKYCEDDLKEVFKLPNRCITIANPVNIAEIELLKKEKQTLFEKKPGSFLFCNIGRYSPAKKQAMLIEAFSKTNDEKAQLLIIGKEVPEMLTALVVKLGLSGRVKLLGLQNNIYPFLILCDCFVLSSEIEGFPNVILEAMACNKPVIAADCKSGPREILAPGTVYPAEMSAPETAEYGLLVPNRDEISLTKAMTEICSNRGLANEYAKKAGKRLDEFSIDKITNQLKETIEAFYNQAM